MLRFVYALALRTGEWNVEGEGGLLSRITLEQLYTWIAYNNLDPFMSWREDWRAGQVAAQVHNANVTKESDLLSAKDFMMESVEEKIARELAESQEVSSESAADHWGMYMKHLEKVAKPVSDGIYKG